MLRKRLISGTAAMVFVLGCAGAPVFEGLDLSFGINASAEDAQNKCGDDLVWNIESGVLSVTGTGNMTDYTAGGAPWYGYAMTKAFIKKGAESVGSNAFGSSGQLLSTFTAGTVLSVGESAYENCTELLVADLSDGLTSVGDYAFCGCTKLLSVRIPASVTAVGEKAFGYKSRTDETPDPGFKIYCYAGTAGEAYAQANSIEYELLEDNYTKDDVLTVCREAGGGSLITEPIQKFLDESGEFFNSDDYAAIIAGIKETSRRYLAPVSANIFRTTPDKLSDTERNTLFLLVAMGQNVDDILNYLQLVTDCRGLNISIGLDGQGKTAVDYTVSDEKKVEAGFSAFAVPVIDSDNEVAPDLTQLTVTAFDAEMNEVLSVNAEANGKVDLRELPAGDYELVFRLDCFAPRTVEYTAGTHIGKVELCKYGDLNSDGIVDGADIALMQQKAAGWDVKFIYKETADVDLSGDHTNADLAILQKLMAGWTVTIGDGKTLEKKNIT